MAGMSWEQFIERLQRGYVAFPTSNGIVGVHVTFIAVLAALAIFTIALVLWLVSRSRPDKASG